MNIKLTFGLVLGFALLNTTAVAQITKPNHFGQGQVISAAQVNANFDVLFSAINSGGGGGGENGSAIVEVSGPEVLNCGQSKIPLILDLVVKNVGGAYNVSNGVYTAQGPKHLMIVAKINVENYKYELSYRINGGTDQYLPYQSGTVYIKLQDGDQLSFHHSCMTKNGPTATINLDSFIAVKPL